MKYLSCFLFAMMLLSLGCEKKEEESDELFDREAMLKNYAENIIQPAYEDVLSSLTNLKSAILDFSSEPSDVRLEKVQTNWLHSFEEWQYASIYNFGPGAEQGINKSLNEEVATFPADATKINDIVSSGNYNLEDFNRDTRGFLAIEYLIFGGLSVNNIDILNLFNTQNYRTDYLIACVDHTIDKIEDVLEVWRNGYSNEFTHNNGTDAGSSTSQLYNEFVKSFETIKNLKLELPLGMRPGQTQEEPHLVQAFYSGFSLEVLKKHIEGIENTYFGTSKTGTEGVGFKDYLETVVGGPDLISETLGQWDQILSSLDAVPTSSPISEQITTNPQPLLELREEFQKHTRFFKSDMSSRLGIAITYSSGDGD